MKPQIFPDDMDSSFLRKRFRQFVVSTKIILILALFNSLLSGSWSYNVYILAALVAGISLIQYFYRYRPVMANNIFLVLCTLMIGFLGWMNGGLRDSSALAYPVLLIFAALFGSRRFFLSVFAFMMLTIVFLGQSTLQGWSPHPLPVFSMEQIIDVLLITSLSAYAARVFSTDMQKVIRDLQHENQRVHDSQKVIQRLARQDPLTKLQNRTACEESYISLIRKLDVDHHVVALYFIDLDNFKHINDSFDHNVGDQLLVTTAKRLESCLGPQDICCRLGGDEFVIFRLCTRETDINAFARRLLDVITRPHDFSGSEVAVTASIGIAIAPEHGRRFDEIRKKADIAMYKAKQIGKNTYYTYNIQLHYEIMRKSDIIQGLTQAVRQEKLEVHYQPKINLATGDIVGAEALLRWQDPHQEKVPPEEFIPIIEASGLIHDIGQWVLYEACRTCQHWHQAGFTTMSVAVNVSVAQFHRVNFLSTVTGALQASGLAPQFLEIELTEHLLLQDNRFIRQQLQDLKNLGVKLSIDDFGTGYSNLSYLTQFKVDVLKLDMSFVSRIVESSEHLAIVKAVLQMAEILGMQVVAEGVEQEAQKLILQELRCDYGQGFLWSAALPQKQILHNLGAAK
ncbi:MAG: EAL domain-containing protein [Thiolinea sp.]